jgi:hypothetical protein
MNDKRVLVTEKDRIRVRNEAVKYGKPSEGIQYNLINFENEIKLLRKTRGLNKLITLIPNRTDVINADNRITKYGIQTGSFTFVKDSENDVLYGIPVGILPDGNIRWRRIIIEEKYTFNLDNEMDCKLYLVMRMHPEVEGSPFQNTDPKYRIYDPEWESEQIRYKAKMARAAMAKIDELTGKNLVYFCRNLGIANDITKETTSNLLISRLEEFAMSNPIEFMERYESSDRSINETIMSGMTFGLLSDRGADGYYYDGVMLGLNIQQVITYMKQNPDLYIRFSKAIEEVDVTTKSIIGEQKGKPGRPAKTGNDDPEKTGTAKKDDDM